MKKKPKRKKPVWEGPEVDGVTQSMLGRFLVCRERFRLRVVEGLQPKPTFNHRLEFGQMWHCCEEAYSEPNPDFCGKDGMPVIASNKVRDYSYALCKKYPLQREQIEKWWRILRVQFPIYLDYWRKHDKGKNRKTLLQEQVFSVPYTLPSGHVVLLRGKWDGVSLIGKGRNAGIYLDEHKTKGEINEEQMKRQLQFDLQTMFYLVALETSRTVWCETPAISDAPIENKIEELTQFVITANRVPIKGVRYNVVRRPLAGGKYSIKPLAGKEYRNKPNVPPETPQKFYERLGGIIATDPEHFFMRWQVEITPADVERFKREFLDPILTELCSWWDWVKIDAVDLWETQELGLHWRHPFGVYNSLNEGGSQELDEYLATGSELGLERGAPLFEELQ